MPEIDVSDVLLDPMIAGEQFQVERRRETVNNFGEVSISTVLLPAIGCIYPSSDELIREDSYETQADAITVITQFPLRVVSKDAATDRFQPDVVIWLGNRYIVKTTHPYIQYGAGWVQAECLSIQFVDNVNKNGP